MHQVLAPTSPSHEVSSPEVPSMTSSVTSHDIRDVLYRDHMSRQMSGLNSGSSNFMMKQQGHNVVPPHDFPYMTPFFYHLQQAFLRSQQQQTNQKMVMDSILQQSNIINEHRKNLLSSFIHQLPPSFHHFQSGKKFHPYGHNGKVMMMMMSKEDDSIRHESKMESETGEDNYEGISSSPRNKKNLYSPSCAGSDVTTERNSPLDDVKLTSSPFKGRNWLISDEERIHSSNITCPVCRLELNTGQMQLHLLQEMQQLKNTSKNISLCDSSSSSLTESRFPFMNGHCTARGMSCKSRYETFARVRNNRETRLAKIRKNRKRSHDQMSQPLIGQQDDGGCNGRPMSPRDEEETIDVISVDDNKENDLKSEDGRYSAKDGVNEEEGSSKDVHSFACPLCLSVGQNPTISTGCWHLMCEPCWKKAVSAQEKCPQCEAAVGLGDLRRIYI